MSSPYRMLRQLLLALLALMSVGQAMAAYSQLIAFGDSLSDTGNLFKLTSGFYPGAPYVDGRFSNGGLAVEAMAADLGLKVTSYAVGGAQTGVGNQGGGFLNGTGVAGQISSYTKVLNGQGADPDALYFLWAGPNDFYAGANIWSSGTSSKASSNMLGNVMELYYMGAQNFFVPLMPDLSLTPASLNASQPYQTAAGQRTDEYNHQLLGGLSNLVARVPGLNIIVFDTSGFMAGELPALRAAGIDTVDACFNSASGHVCAMPNTYLFWDGQHPTAFTHQILGQAFASAANVPEPGVWLLMSLGLLAMAVVRLSRPVR